VPSVGWQGAGLLQVTVLPLVAAAIMLIVRTPLFNNAVRAASH
jgi:hypothetical protein